MKYEDILHFLFFINIYFIHYIFILYIMLYFVNNVNYWDSSSGQAWTGLLHQNELEQSWPKGIGAAWYIEPPYLGDGETQLHIMWKAS